MWATHTVNRKPTEGRAEPVSQPEEVIYLEGRCTDLNLENETILPQS